MKKIIVIALLFPLLFYLFISQVHYKLIRVYPAQQIRPEVKDWIETEAKGKNISDINSICDFSNKIVSEHLSYGYTQSIRNPNTAWRNRDVNCLGYAALQTAVINQLIKDAKLGDWRAKQHSCMTYLGPFWFGIVSTGIGYHSYTVVINTNTHQKIIPDACLYDLIFVGYLREH